MTDQLRELKRILPALRSFRKDISTMIPWETYVGQSRMLVRTYRALHGRVKKILSDDPFVAALVVDLPEKADDRTVTQQIVLLNGQLFAYVEGLIEELDEASKNIPYKPPSEAERRARRAGDVLEAPDQKDY